MLPDSSPPSRSPGYPRRGRSALDDSAPGISNLHDYERPTTAGMIGFILSLVSLGLLGVVAVLWYALSVENQQQNNAERTRLMFYWFTFLDVASFFVALAATLFAIRGMAAANPLYRGYGLTAMILGIVELGVTAMVGFILFCSVMVLEIFRNGG